MQMRCRRVRVAGAADVADHIAALQLFSFGHVGGVTVEVRVVIGEALAGVEMVDRQATRDAFEELRDLAVLHGDDRRAAGRRDIERLVRPYAAAGLVERIGELRGGDAEHGNEQRARAWLIGREGSAEQAASEQYPQGDQAALHFFIPAGSPACRATRAWRAQRHPSWSSGCSHATT